LHKVKVKIEKISKLRLVLLVLTTIFVGGSIVSCSSNNEITSGLLAPEPADYSGGVIQVYSARTKGAKQTVSVHTWFSVKRANDSFYTSYEIIGWRLRRNDTALVVRTTKPDRDWWGHQPKLLLDHRTGNVDELIDKIEAAVESYEFKSEYQAYPGPNSNTFTASIARAVPELGLDLPSTAIGKDYKTLSEFIGRSASGGLQASFLGLLALTIGKEEGLELNILGLNFEFDVFDLAIELPAIGRIGTDAATVNTTHIISIENKETIIKTAN
jgi:hypothetical protein